MRRFAYSSKFIAAKFIYILIILTIFLFLDDEESVQDTISTADNLEDDNFSLSEIKPDDRARREEIIETLIELEIVNLNQAQKISNIKVLHTCTYSVQSVLVFSRVGLSEGLKIQ